MNNLIWLQKDKDLINMTSEEIHPEEAIEELLFKKKGILDDISIIQRQVKSNNGQDRLDLLGIDSDNNIVILEIKDELVTEDIIPQVLRYGMWVETNPDSIKNLVLESPYSDDFTNLDWDDLNIKIIIVAPSFKPNIKKLIKRVGYDVELLELKKFSDGKEEFILLQNVELEEENHNKTSTCKKEYNLEFYKSERNPNSAEDFVRIAESIDAFVKKKEWNLQKQHNSSYIGFKYGYRNVFGIQFIGSKSYGFFFKIPKEDYDQLKSKIHGESRYNEQWKQAEVKITNPAINLNEYDALFETAHKHIR